MRVARGEASITARLSVECEMSDVLLLSGGAHIAIVIHKLPNRVTGEIRHEPDLDRG